jgi:hypothetical protein
VGRSRFAFRDEVVEELIGVMDPLALAVVSIGLEEIGMLEHGSKNFGVVARELSAIQVFGDGSAPIGTPMEDIFRGGWNGWVLGGKMSEP